MPTLAGQLVRDYGRGFAEENLRRMVQFATTFSDEPIVVTLSRLLSWSHIVSLLPLKDPLCAGGFVGGSLAGVIVAACFGSWFSTLGEVRFQATPQQGPAQQELGLGF